MTRNTTLKPNPPRTTLSADALNREKADLRRRLRERRAALGEMERKALSAAIVGHLLALPVFRAAAHVHCFISLPEEVRTEGIFTACREAGKETSVQIGRAHV